MTRPKLYIHIGHPKAGSTTIQSFLYENWRVMETRGYALPSSDLRPGTESNPPGNPLQALIQLVESQDLAPLQEWSDRILSSGDTKLLLSSEYLINPGCARVLAPLAGSHAIHLIYYVRRQDEQLLAAWAQWGHKRGLSLDELVTRRIRNNQPDYAAIVAEWQDAMPLASIRVRFLGKAFLSGGDLLTDFCEAIGTPADGLATVRPQNVSLDGRLLHFMSRHPELYTSVHDQALLEVLSRAVGEAPVVRAKLTKFQFDTIRAHFEPLNQRLLQAFHPDREGTPVIDEATAPVFKNGEGITLETQHSFMASCLDKVKDSDHPRIPDLRSALQRELA